MNDVFPKRLRRLRIERRKTQGDMAEVLNIQRTTYGEYERGKITPPIDKLETIARILDTTPQYLIGWDDTDNANRLAEKWLKESANITLTDEEYDKLIEYAKFLNYLREERE